MSGDLLALESESADGAPLLRPVMRAGAAVASLPSLSGSRKAAAEALARLPAALRRLEAGASCPVAVSDGLRALARDMDQPF
jgi:nicotinate phosphoribosyltransferase